MSTFATALLSILLSVCAQFMLKAGMSGLSRGDAGAERSALATGLHLATDKFILGGFMLYGLGAVIWLVVLAKWDVSKAYPLVGAGFAITAVFGFMLGEQVSVARVVGIALICAGVAVVARS